MKITRTALLFILIFSSRASAWNDCGHMTIAAIAYSQLSEKAKPHIDELLRRNPSYSQWTNDVTLQDRPRVAFMRASTWPDDIRRDPSYFDKNDNNKNLLNSGYRDKSLHRSWHYINKPFSTDHTQLRDAGQPNIQTQLSALHLALQTNHSNSDVSSYNLIWFIHLVGDAHQPLHATSRFARNFPQGDRGGNSISICEKTCDENLHAYWDQLLGTTRKPAAIQRAAEKYPAADGRLAVIVDEHVWLDESAEIARRIVYAAPFDDAGENYGADNIALTPPYAAAATRIARQQAAVAGARLANALNRIFSD
ncbi:MAG: nuclease [Verrucomicrobiaceae bacterium]|nr:nuclease [Verrucomicrobiaceae bacterium]